MEKKFCKCLKCFFRKCPKMKFSTSNESVSLSIFCRNPTFQSHINPYPYLLLNRFLFFQSVDLSTFGHVFFSLFQFRNWPEADTKKTSEVIRAEFGITLQLFSILKKSVTLVCEPKSLFGRNVFDTVLCLVANPIGKCF